MPRKAVDSRIPALIRNGIQEKKRSFIVVVGDRAKDVIVHLHYIMSSVNIKQNKSVLWAYKKDLLGFTSHRKKRENKIKKEVKRGIREPNTEDPFELFVTLHNIRYVYYKETDKILGNTYGMCILQDFEALTPNLLARTVETAEGGGLVLLLLKGMNSLKQLYTLSMDIHSRYRTEAHDDVVARFNERFILSLGSCESCLVVDDELNVLPISGGKNIKPLPPPDPEEEANPSEKKELEEIKTSLENTQPLGSLVKLAKTVDQANALHTFVDAIAEKTLRSTVTLTAARGRGKSAAMGVAIAAAIAHGYSNIFITSPSPENLKTLFDFVFKGFDALNYLDHADYTIIQSTNPDFNKAIVRVNVHRQHRQTIQYIQPQDAYALGQAELVVIDEAAAIPLPLVRKLMGPYLVFMASTINGYEGTGRSLSLKLIQQLREQSRGISKPLESETITADRSSQKPSTNGGKSFPSSRSLREITLSEPIRYSQNDPVESWLNKLLCLDTTLPKAKSTSLQGCPHPSSCQLLQVNRDTLFSFHPVSEKFLHQMMALYVASHYKNTPNDLQLMSDAPAHNLFVLVPPIDNASTRLPELLCVIQVALEGQISRQSVLSSLSRGQRPGGDLIPWIVSQQFQDEDFASLSGARIVRIATSPDYANMGYGSQALSLLVDFYAGKYTSLQEDSAVDDGVEKSMPRVTDADLENPASLIKDDITVRDINAMPPLFSKLSEQRPPLLDYIGVSFGLTVPLHKFWKRAQFTPVYLRQTATDLTGEHSCVMIRTLATPSTSADDDNVNDGAWLGAFARDFQKRFLSLLSYPPLRAFPSILAISMYESVSQGSLRSDPLHHHPPPLSKVELESLFSPFDLKRLDSYANNMLDYHVVLDMFPSIASLYFTGKLEGTVKLSGLQAALLLALGLQRKGVEDVEKEVGVQAQQLLAMVVKLLRKIAKAFAGLIEGVEEGDKEDGKIVEDVNGQNKETVHVGSPAVEDVANGNGEAPDPSPAKHSFEPLEQTLTDDLREGSEAINKELREKQKALVDALPLDRYALSTSLPSWADAEAQVSRKTNNKRPKFGKASALSEDQPLTVSIKSDRPKAVVRMGEEDDDDNGGGRREGKRKKGKDGGGEDGERGAKKRRRREKKGRS